MKQIVVLFLTVVFTCTGCATQEELQRVEVRLGAKITALEQRVRENSESIKSSGKIQADAGADLVDIRDDVQKLRGIIERLEVKVSALESKPEEPHVSLNDIKDLSNRLTHIENYLDTEKTDEAQESGEGTGDVTEKEESTSREEAYANAYSKFKSGQYDTARDEFRNFLKIFPDSEYSDNAQFWIGECNYFQGKYEEAIIEYEVVIKNYPKGNKVPNALLKQALSFLKLGDKSSAKLLLQGVIKDYPNTTPANVARKKLIDLK